MDIKVIELNSVSKSYNNHIAIDNCSLNIVQEKRVVILGASGCGKTTILRLIAGFIAPETGSIRLNGQQVSANNKILVPPEKRNIGMVFQNLALWPHLSVHGNLAFGLKAQAVPEKEREKRIYNMLKLVGLSRLAQRKPSELSGGQQQRVALARALILNPDIILMDEPLSSLDEDLNIRLRTKIVELQENLGFTLLYVTHNLQEAFSIAHTVVLLKHGRVEFQGSVKQAKRLWQRQ